MNKCKKCGSTELRWLYYSTDQIFEGEFNQTDYILCLNCDTIYRQWIESKVHRDEIKAIYSDTKWKAIKELEKIDDEIYEKLANLDLEKEQLKAATIGGCARYE